MPAASVADQEAAEKLKVEGELNDSERCLS